MTTPLEKAITPFGAGFVWSIVPHSIYMRYSELWTSGDENVNRV